MGDRPILLVDMDGPLADFDKVVYERCGEQGWPMDCTSDTQTARFSTDHVIDRHHRRAARKMINEAGWFADLPLVEGARDGIHELAKHGDVWICTKPLEANQTCRDDKGRWVAQHLGREWERRLIITPDKSLVHGSLLLDDAPFPEWFDRATWNPVIFTTSWNGDGSVWADLPHWDWTQPVEPLLECVICGECGRSGVHTHPLVDMLRLPSRSGGPQTMRFWKDDGK